MKKIVLLMLVFSLMLSVVACFDTEETTTTTTTSTTTNVYDDEVPPELRNFVKEVVGLNEQIIVTIDSSFYHGDFEVYYKKSTDAEFSKLDDELMIADEDVITAYILGLSAGEYTVEVKAIGLGAIGIDNINVLAQDRSGYAHFGATEGVGAYNNDGTVKEGTKIIYVTNANKNTVTCEINGETYTGLVNILQAQYKSDTPMLVRIIGKITTNQWNYKNVEPRLYDNSNATDDFFVNTFSTEYGENLANLRVTIKGDKTYAYKTTPEGLGEVRIGNNTPKSVDYKGSDFPSLKGKKVYDDDSYYNMLEVSGVKNVTIEGVGEDAEIFQFGISFEKSNNIEIKNLTFTDYPEDALNFLGDSRSDLANFSRYWVHNCTFNRGYNAWDISGERDKYAGDGSIDFNNVSNLTLAYNVFNNSKKSMLFGSGNSEACMNMTMHHNHFYKVESRLPLGRNVNIHSYNNYFEECVNCHDLRVNSYIFSEANYFKSSSRPFILDTSYAKSFGDIFITSGGVTATVVTDRTKTLSGTCKPDTSNNLMNFDTNANLFYYDSANQKSNVSVLNDAKDVPEFVTKHAGAGNFELLVTE